MAFYRPGARGGRQSAVPEVPEARRPERSRVAGWSALALVLPVVVSAAMVPLRDDIDRSTAALVLVLPVVLVAVRGGRVPAGLAAVAAPLSFDVLLTRPYQRLDIAVAADVEAAVILLVVGLTVAVLVSNAAHAQTVAKAREREVRALEAVIQASRSSSSDEELAERTCTALTDLLELRSCRWSPGYRGSAYPVLEVGGEVSDSGLKDRAPLPSTGVEIPVLNGGHELGRIVAVPASDRPRLTGGAGCCVGRRRLVRPCVESWRTVVRSWECA